MAMYVIDSNRGLWRIDRDGREDWNNIAVERPACPHCGHRSSGRGSATVDSLPLFGARRRGVFGRAARRLVAALIVGAGAVALFLLSHLARTPGTHQADDQEERCRIIEESGEASPGELADCQAKLAYLRAVERATQTPPARTLDSVRQSP